jgi:hypothetical protein
MGLDTQILHKYRRQPTTITFLGHQFFRFCENRISVFPTLLLFDIENSIFQQDSLMSFVLGHIASRSRFSCSNKNYRFLINRHVSSSSQSVGIQLLVGAKRAL